MRSSWRTCARVAAATAGLGVTEAVCNPALAQHEHHGRPAAQVLDTVRASAARETVMLRSGATVVDVPASIAAGGSIADVLRTVPGVELDANGRIAMRGSASVQVLLDGRRIPLAGDALAAYLRQMPAAALERVEAGTRVPAAHDTEGVAGVINLVSRHDGGRRSGTRSVAGSVASHDHYMGSAAASGSVRGSVTWDATYSRSGMRPRTRSETTRYSVVPGVPVRHVDSHAQATHRLHSVGVGTAAHPARGVSLELRGTYTWMEGAYRTNTAFAELDAGGSTRTNATTSALAHAIPAAELGAIARVDLGSIQVTSEVRASGSDEQFSGEDAQGAYRFLVMTMESAQREHLLRNAVHASIGGIELDVGHASRFRTMRARRNGNFGGAPLADAFRHEAALHAGYATAQRAAGRLHAEAGLRVESERTRVVADEATSRRASRLLPDVQARWSDVHHAIVYRVAYARRIDRPGAGMLNPYGMGEHDLNAIVGNPALLPEVADGIEAGVERTGSRVALQVTSFHRWSRDPVRPLKLVTGHGHATTTLQNLASSRTSGVEGSMRARLPRGSVVTMGGSIAHMQATSPALGSSGMHATMRVAADLAVSATTTAHAYAYRRSAQATEQGEILPAFTSQLAVTRRIAGDRGRVTLRLNDPLQTDHLAFRIADTAFTQQGRQRTAQPLLSLFASYAVGGRPREDAPVRAEGPVRIF